MPRYIDADAFFADFAEIRDYEYASQEYEVDAVEVVRCKECKHRDPEDKKCDCGHDILWQLPRKDNWYCADGERRDDGHN